MTVFLPLEGFTTADVIKNLKSVGLDAVRYMSNYEVDLWLPRFETTYHIKLNDILSEMGMPSSFDSSKADFTAMSAYAAYLSFVQQDAVIKVDEEGSEAAVVSSAGMMKNAAGPVDHVVFHADHPFLYMITESSTGAVLFAGRYSGK
jgi:serpin B